MVDDRNIRRFLETALASALDLGLIDEGELIATVGPDRLIEEVTVEARAKLLVAFLEAEDVSSELLVRTLGIATIAGSAPATLLWKAVALAGRRAAGDAVDGPSLAAALDVDVRGSAPSAPAPKKTKRKSKSKKSDDAEAEESRKPNRRVTGAGATSRRRSRESAPPPVSPNDSPTKSIFVASRRTSHRAATEPAIIGDDIAEIEVIDETDVAVKRD